MKHSLPFDIVPNIFENDEIFERLQGDMIITNKSGEIKENFEAFENKNLHGNHMI